jgi:hypothetical protein
LVAVALLTTTAVAVVVQVLQEQLELLLMELVVLEETALMFIHLGYLQPEWVLADT